jgi:hypothetical protein
MNIIKSAVLVFIAITIFGCGKNLEKEVTRLVDAKNKWLKYGYGKEYSYIIIRECFCPYDDKEIKVTVSKGKVIFATYLTTSNDKEQLSLRYFPTLRQMFEFILERIKNDNIYRLTVDYHQLYGYPTLVEYSSHMIDGSGKVTIRDVYLIKNLTRK